MLGCFLVLLVSLVSGSPNDKFLELGEVYDRLVTSNFNNVSVLNRETLLFPVLFFNPKLYKEENLSESTARLAVQSIMQFLDYEADYDFEKCLECPTEGLEMLYEKFPKVFTCFPSFDELIKQIKCRILINQQDGSSYYEAFKLCPKFFNATLVKRLANLGHCLDGYLVSTLLTQDHVMPEFVVHMMQDAKLFNVNEEFLDQQSREEVWHYFFANIRVCLEMDAPTVEAILMRSIQSLLHKPHLYELIKRCKECTSGDAQSVIVFASWVALSSPIGVCPALTLNHIRSIRNNSNSTNSSTSLVSNPNGTNHFARLPYEAIVIIFEECYLEGVEPSLSLVSKQFHTGTTFMNYNTHFKVIGKSRKQAIRFINDVNRPTMCPSEITLGPPWNLSDPEKIMSLFVHAMTCHKVKITMRNLVRDYARGFPEFYKSDPLREKWYESWATIVGGLMHFAKSPVL